MECSVCFYVCCHVGDDDDDDDDDVSQLDLNDQIGKWP